MHRKLENIYLFLQVNLFQRLLLDNLVIKWEFVKPITYLSMYSKNCWKIQGLKNNTLLHTFEVCTVWNSFPNDLLLLVDWILWSKRKSQSFVL